MSNRVNKTIIVCHTSFGYMLRIKGSFTWWLAHRYHHIQQGSRYRFTIKRSSFGIALSGCCRASPSTVRRQRRRRWRHCTRWGRRQSSWAAPTSVNPTSWSVLAALSQVSLVLTSCYCSDTLTNMYFIYLFVLTSCCCSNTLTNMCFIYLFVLTSCYYFNILLLFILFIYK